MEEYHDYTDIVNQYSENIESLTLKDSDHTLTVLKKDQTKIVYDCPEIDSFSYEFSMAKLHAYNQQNNLTLIDNLIDSWISAEKLKIKE
jgi:hypothetical protein